MADSKEKRAEAEAAQLRPRLAALRCLYNEVGLSAPDVCVAYIAAYLQVRHGATKWLGGKRKALPEIMSDAFVSTAASCMSVPFQRLVSSHVLQPLPPEAISRFSFSEASTMYDVLCCAQLLTLPAHATECLFNWYAGRRPLELLWRIPSAEELLDMQASGSRCVSALVSDWALGRVFGHRDCYDMLLHDLAHAEKFVHHGLYWQQVGFFEFLRVSVAPIHRERWAVECGHRWRLAWQYVSSDMNAAAVHLLMTLKCQLVGAIVRRTLWKAHLTIPGEEAEEKEFADLRADIYPKSLSPAWRDAVELAGLGAACDDSFASEWNDVLTAHMQDVRERFPDILEVEETSSVQHLDDATVLSKSVQHLGDAARVSKSAAIADAFNNFGSGFQPGSKGDACPETACYGKYSPIITAHFEEFGRRLLR